MATQATVLSAAPRPINAETRLRHCGGETCLQVSGHRTDAAMPVLLAGHEVTVQGARSWHVALPLETVRSWSAPFARSIAVNIDGSEAQARLPTGLLGHVSDLAFLEVSATR